MSEDFDVEARRLIDIRELRRGIEVAIGVLMGLRGCPQNVSHSTASHLQSRRMPLHCAERVRQRP